MISYHYTKNWRALLLALPLLLSSLAAQATNHILDISDIFQTNDGLKLVDGQYRVVFSYTVQGNIYDFDCAKGLSFSIGSSTDTNDESLLKMVTKDSFSGKLKSIEILGHIGNSVVAKAFVMGENMVELGQLKVPENTNGGRSVLSGLSVPLQDQKILLQFTADPNAPADVSAPSVTGMVSVKITLDDTAAPLSLGEVVTFGAEELKTADLTNYSYKGILFTLNTATDGEGIDFTDGSDNPICFMTPLTDETVSWVNNAVNNAYYHPGDWDYATNFSGGITMMVAGSGKIALDTETEEGYAFHVKIGSAEPVEISSASRQELRVPYSVEEDTYVYIYMVEKNSGVRAGTRIGRRATAYGKIYYAKCVSSVDLPGDVNGNGTVDWNDVKAIVDYIMGTPPAGFSMAQANVNGDGVVNVADLVEVIQYVKEHTPAE